MSFTHSLAMTYTAATGVVASTVQTYTGDISDDLSVAVPASATDTEYDMTITRSKIVAMGIYCDQAVTVKTNRVQLAPPAAPTLSSSAAGALGATTYYVTITYVDAVGETTPSSVSSLAVVANDVLVVDSPAASGAATGYNVYVGTAAGSETKQNSSPITIGSNWTEPTSGLVAGAAAPASNTTAAPDDTIVLTAKKLVQWTNDSTAAKPFSTDVTKLFVTNPASVAANFTVRVLETA